MSFSAATSGTEPEPKRRKLLDAGGPIEDDETARQKMRDAAVYARGVVRKYGEWDGFDPDDVTEVKSSFHIRRKDITPMGYFAWKGDLPMMRWLYVNGADTRDVDVDINFPMFRAAVRGHFEVCKWLFAHGAAKDIKRRTRGSSPLGVSFAFSDQRDLSRWLILNGALCKDDDSGDLDVEIMQYDFRTVYTLDRRFQQERKALLEWANDLHRPRTSFLLFLSGAHSGPRDACSTRQHVSPLQLFGGKPGILELIGDYVGFVRGREARIVRQLTKLMPGLP